MKIKFHIQELHFDVCFLFFFQNLEFIDFLKKKIATSIVCHERH